MFSNCDYVSSYYACSEALSGDINTGYIISITAYGKQACQFTLTSFAKKSPMSECI